MCNEARRGEDFPKLLRMTRRRRGVSQKVLAELCGISRNTICEYEAGRYHPSAENLCKIADFFDISVDYLLGREEKQTSGRGGLFP